MDWSTFYLGLAGAAATVTGLLFIAVQINMDTLVSGIGERSSAIARATFTLFALLVVLPLIYLIPGINLKGQAIFTVLVSGFGIVRVLRSWLPAWTSMIRRGVRERLWETAWLLIAPIIVYAFIIYNSYGLLTLDQSAQTILQTNIAICLVGLFSIALRNSWNLIFEATYQRKRENLQSGPK